MKRIHAQLFQHGVPEPPHKLDTVPGRLWLAKVDLPPAARQVVDVACDMIDTLDGKVRALDRELKPIARCQKGCVVLQQQVGVGPIISASMLAELGDVPPVRRIDLDQLEHDGVSSEPDREPPMRPSSSGDPSVQPRSAKRAGMSAPLGITDEDGNTTSARLTG